MVSRALHDSVINSLLIVAPASLSAGLSGGFRKPGILTLQPTAVNVT